MDNRVKINIPKELQEYMWFRYMPLSTYKTYIVVGATNSQNLKGLEATQKILNTNLMNFFQYLSRKWLIFNWPG